MSNFKRAGPAPQANSILKTLQATEMLDTKPVLPAGESLCLLQSAQHDE